MHLKLVCVVLLIGALAGCGRPAPDAQPTGSPGRVAAIESMLGEALAEPVGGVVAAVRFPDGETVFAAMGYAVEGEMLETGDSFRVASIGPGRHGQYHGPS